MTNYILIILAIGTIALCVLNRTTAKPEPFSIDGCIRECRSHE